MADNNAALRERFVAAGLDPRTVGEVLKNNKLSASLAGVLDEAGVEAKKGCEKSIGMSLYNVAARLPADLSPVVKENRSTLLRYIMDKRIKTQKQVDAALKYFKGAIKWSEEAFKTAAGVGVEITKEDVVRIVRKTFDDNDELLKKERYLAITKLRQSVSSGELMWGDSRSIMEEFEANALRVLGPKSEIDRKGGTKPAKSTAKPAKPASTGSGAKPSGVSAAAAAAAPSPSAPSSVVPSEPKAKAVSEENKYDFIDEGRDLPAAHNTEAQLARHIAATGGATITRFPPEPNGFMHIGHCKACCFSFGVAKSRGGRTVLRFDDTNPEAEKKEFIDSIIDNIHWLGHRPCAVTYSSDYFQELHDLAVKLIKKGKAYVDHQTKAEIEESRKTKIPSPWRDRSVEENLALFESMRKGKFPEGSATLRMKGDMNSPNPQMWDIIAYRIRYTPHPHVGDKWCIYPSYDFTHCIIDSLENITHSLCTLEFEIRRESYYWLLDELDLYKPKVWEFARLNITNNVMSKRKLRFLVEAGHVSGWDDPRLMTVNGLRRRGYTPEGINSFCDLLGVTRNDSCVDIGVLEMCCRDNLEPLSRRAFAVTKPLKVTLTNWPEDNRCEWTEKPNFPRDPSKGMHKVPLSRVVYIEQDDFRDVDEKSYYGLAPNKEVQLKYSYNIKCNNVLRGPDGRPTELLCTFSDKDIKRCKGKIHWVSSEHGKQPTRVEIRLYDRLFKSADPSALEEKWLDDLNPNSLTVCDHAMTDSSMVDAKSGEHYQFERVGFFFVDSDTDKPNGPKVFNRTVRLQEKKKEEMNPNRGQNKERLERERTEKAAAKREKAAREKAKNAAAAAAPAAASAAPAPSASSS